MTIDPKNLSATATLTFSDEFNTLSLWNGTSGTWNTNYWWGQPNGSTLPGNGEQEWYINNLYPQTSSVKPWTVSNGVLTLTAAPANTSIQPYIDNYKYTSGMIQTFESFTQQYGYFEIRADLPSGQGVWPAFWLLPANGTWPPEIDVFEVLGNDPSMLYTTMHTNVTGSHTSSGIGTRVADMSAGYHTYGVDWEADYITWYFDGNQVYKVATPGDWHQPAYMIANITLGGYWPGNVNSTTPFPAEMKIDYIHAYADKGLAPPPPVQGPPPPASGGSNPPPSGGSSDPIRGPRRDDTHHGRDDGSNPPSSGGSSDPIRGPRRDDTHHGRDDGSDPIRGPRRDDTHHGRDRSDTIRGTQRDDTHDSRDGSDTIRGTQRDDTHQSTLTANRTDVRGGSDTMSGNDGNAKHLEDRSAGSDTFTFSKKAIVQGDSISDLTVRTDMLDHSATDQYLSFQSDGAGSTKVDFDPGAAGTAHQSPWQITALDHVQPTGVHMHADWVLH